MKILVTGANGYIGQRLLVSLLALGHKVVCLVRDPTRLNYEKFIKSRIDKDLLENINPDNLEVIKGDLTQTETLSSIPQDIDVAYYLVHSMRSSKPRDFEELESICAHNFVDALKHSSVEQVIYLSGISNDDRLSKHLRSRYNVEKILREGDYHLTVLRAAIIIGSGSASFEIIRDLVERLPIMVTPKWIDTKCQPIAIANVIQYLTGVILQKQAYDKVFDIGGPDILTYKEMLLGYAKERSLKRYIFSLPILSPRVSSYWLYLITSTNYHLARSLIESLRNEVVCINKGIEEIVALELYSYEVALKRALYVISENRILSSWKDSFIGGRISKFDAFFEIEVPRYGCLVDRREIAFTRDIDEVKQNIWDIGGDRGWYYMNWAWNIRGYIDKLFGGVGLRRGRRDYNSLKPGDALDFWRVLSVNEEDRHLVLYAEMRLPGEAWLEFKLKEQNGNNVLVQQATYRPHGLWGWLYWYLLIPVHYFLFEGMARRIISH